SFFSGFFFSSRRRHTRWPRDWSSDVCSSDLVVVPAVRPMMPFKVPEPLSVPPIVMLTPEVACNWICPAAFRLATALRLAVLLMEIGRASCRERVVGWVGGVSVQRDDVGHM